MWDELSDVDSDFEGQISIQISRKAGAYRARVDLPERVPAWMDVGALQRRAARAAERMSPKVDLSIVHSQIAQAVQEELGRQRAKVVA
jgi:hypothetical protein